MQIRVATVHDIEKLVQMRWDFSVEYDENISPNSSQDFGVQCTQFLSEASGGSQWKIWVADEEGILVSHVYVQLIAKVPRPGWRSKFYGYLTNVYTIPARRGCGIGTLLLRAVDHWARTTDVEFLIVWPSDNSIEFYRRNGFIPSEEAMEKHL